LFDPPSGYSGVPLRRHPKQTSRAIVTAFWVYLCAVIILSIPAYFIDASVRLPMPLFLLFPLTAAAIALAAARRSWLQDERKFRIATCRCVSCGYQLTGNTSNVCPECGTIVTQEIAYLHKSQ
jgi:hypothetical protein